MMKKNKLNDNERRLKIRNKSILIGVLIGIMNMFISIFLLSSNYSLDDLIIFIVPSAFGGALIGFFVYLSVNFYKFKRMKLILFFTLLFFISSFLSLFGIPPFGFWGTIGDIVVPVPTLLIIIFGLPLILLKLIFFLLGFNIMTIHNLIIMLSTIIISIGYYYLLSKVMISFCLKKLEVSEK